MSMLSWPYSASIASINIYYWYFMRLCVRVCVCLNGSLQYTSSICAEVLLSISWFPLCGLSAFWFLLFFHPKNRESFELRHPSNAPCFLHSICDTCKFMQFLLKPSYVFRTSMCWLMLFTPAVWCASIVHFTLFAIANII